MKKWKRSKIQIDPLRETCRLHTDKPKEEHLEVTAYMMVRYSSDCVRIADKAIDNMLQCPPETHISKG